MTQLVVDFDRLRAAVDHMATFGREVAECLEDIDQTMAALRHAWRGEGSDAQAHAQQQWRGGGEQMRSALTALEQVADTAHRHYSDAVAKNGQMWQS